MLQLTLQSSPLLKQIFIWRECIFREIVI
jgi:hypothetical protein